jgi:hypothetical protein
MENIPFTTLLSLGMLVVTLWYVYLTYKISASNNLLAEINKNLLTITKDNIDSEKQRTYAYSSNLIAQSQRDIMKIALLEDEYMKLFAGYTRVDFIHSLFINHQYTCYHLCKSDATYPGFWDCLALEIQHLFTIESFQKHWTHVCDFYPKDFQSEMNRLMNVSNTNQKHFGKRLS